MMPVILSQTAFTAGHTVSHGNAEQGFRPLVIERDVVFDFVEFLARILQKRIVPSLIRVLELLVRVVLRVRFWDVGFFYWLRCTAGLFALLYELRDRPIFLTELSDAVLVMMNAADRTEDQPGAQHDQTKVQEHQRRQHRHHLLHAVIARGRDERAQDRQRQGEDGDTGAQGGQRSSFLSEEHLDFAKDDIVQLR